MIAEAHQNLPDSTINALFRQRPVSLDQYRGEEKGSGILSESSLHAAAPLAGVLMNPVRRNERQMI